MSRIASMRREVQRLREAVGPDPSEPVAVPEYVLRAVARLIDEDEELGELTARRVRFEEQWRRAYPNVQHIDHGTPAHNAYRALLVHPRAQEARKRYHEIALEERAHVTAERIGDRLLSALAHRLRDERLALRSGNKELPLGSLDPHSKPPGWTITHRERAHREHIRRYEQAVRDRIDALRPLPARPGDTSPEPSAQPITDPAEAELRALEIVAGIEDRRERAARADREWLGL